MKKHEPTFIIVEESDGHSALVVAIIQGRDSCHYLVGTTIHQWGEMALRFEKECPGDGTDPEETSYNVLLDEDNSACSCKGCQRHGMCKHIRAAEWLKTQEAVVPPWRDWPDRMIRVRIAE